MYPTPKVLWATGPNHPPGFSVRNMDTPIEPSTVRDTDHRCPICGGETELISIALTHWDGRKYQAEVTPKRRRCAALDCQGHSGLHEPADG